MGSASYNLHAVMMLLLLLLFLLRCVDSTSTRRSEAFYAIGTGSAMQKRKTTTPVGVLFSLVIQLVTLRFSHPQ